MLLVKGSRLPGCQTDCSSKASSLLEVLCLLPGIVCLLPEGSMELSEDGSIAHAKDTISNGSDRFHH